LTRRACLVLALLAAGFATETRADTPAITLASTTSTENSGLFDHLLPRFTEATGISVRVVAVGTGQALRIARNGDADVLLVHDRASEERFVAEGWGVERLDVMYNDFVLVGPASDPAGIRGASNVTSALRKIATAATPFASRGDDSGTHQKERALWAETGIDPAKVGGTWYRETGSGMGATLNVAIGKDAYVMTDRATWISFQNKRKFEILVEGDPQLFNQYGVILVNAKKHPHVKTEYGRAFIDWLLGEAGQNAIAAFKVDGKQLFYPNAQLNVQH